MLSSPLSEADSFHPLRVCTNREDSRNMILSYGQASLEISLVAANLKLGIHVMIILIIEDHDRLAILILEDRLPGHPHPRGSSRVDVLIFQFFHP